MKSRETELSDVKLAAENLSKKTGLEWKYKEHKGNMILYTEGVIGSTQHILSNILTNIHFKPSICFNTEYGLSPSHGKSSIVFERPFEIEAMAKNQFAYPLLPNEVLTNAVCKLSSATGWECSTDRTGLRFSKKVHTMSFESAKSQMICQLKSAGLTHVVPSFLPSKLAVGEYRIIGYFNSPSEIHAISNFQTTAQNKDETSTLTSEEMVQCKSKFQDGSTQLLTQEHIEGLTVSNLCM
ncbi:hypothetical protein [Legionella genomosp. 1]|uniref:hypothetical protein n=1 Tax=Legionella genomosp. 1 TaxID=1093625 RepID=UPI0010546723|nr:hypothetical protein [Legionella genomosp. 1]